MDADLIQALRNADLADETLIRIAHCYANLAPSGPDRTLRMLAVIGPRIADASGDYERVASLLSEIMWVAS